MKLRTRKITGLLVFLALCHLSVASLLNAEESPDEQEPQTKTTSVSDLLPFAEAKYNRVILNQYQPQHVENARLKNAITALEEAKDEKGKTEQWKIIVQEFFANSLTPDAWDVLRHLPEEEQVAFIHACATNGSLRWNFFFNAPPLTNWSLSGAGTIRRMQVDLFQNALLRRDFQTASRLLGDKSDGSQPLNALMIKTLSGMIKVFQKNNELKSMDEYYRFLEENWEKAQWDFIWGGTRENAEVYALTDAWIPQNREAMLAFHRALFHEEDAALKSAEKIENEQQRYFMIWSLAQMKAFFGDLDGAVKMWQAFPKEMFESDFAKKIRPLRDDEVVFPNEETPQRCERFLLHLLIEAQLCSGIKTEKAIPFEIVLPLIHEDWNFRRSIAKSLYANGHIEELCSLFKKSELFPISASESPGIHYSAEVSAALFAAELADNAQRLGNRDTAVVLLNEAFEQMRKIDGGKFRIPKRQAMQRIADVRYDGELYDMTGAFTREELDHLDEEDHYALPWFKRNKEEIVVRNRELQKMNASLPESENPFFAAALRKAFLHDNFAALAVAVKGMAQCGEKDLALQYVEKLKIWCVPGSIEKEEDWKRDSKLEALSQVARTQLLLEVEAESIAETLELMRNTITPGREFLCDGQVRDIANFAAKMNRGELFEKTMRLTKDRKKAEEAIREYRSAKVEHEQYLERLKHWESGQWKPLTSRFEKPVFAITPETTFDGYATEIEELHGWRNPYALLMKKMPTAVQAKKVPAKHLADTRRIDIPIGYSSRNGFLFSRTESATNAVKRLRKTVRQSEQVKNDPDCEQDLSDAALRDLALIYVRRGEHERVQTVLEEIKHPVPKSEVLLTLVVRKYDLSDPRDESVFDEFQSHQDSYATYVPPKNNRDANITYYRDEYYSAYIIRLAQRGLLDRAEKNLPKIEAPFQKAEAVYTIAMKYALLGEYEKAILIAREMKDAATGSYTRWRGVHADGIGPQYTKLRTLVRIFEIAHENATPKHRFEPLDLLETLQSHEAKADLLLAIVSRNTTINSTLIGSIHGTPFQKTYPIQAEEGKILLQDSEADKNLLRRAFEETMHIETKSVREEYLMQLLPFLLSANLVEESFTAANTLDTDNVFDETQRRSEYSHETKIPELILSVAQFLSEHERGEDANALCEKTISWLQDLKYVGPQGGLWPNLPNDTRNRIICIAAAIQARAGFREKALQTLREERERVDAQAQRAAFLQRIAETLYDALDEKELAEKTYTAAVESALGQWPDAVMANENDQRKWFTEVVESYAKRFSR